MYLYLNKLYEWLQIIQSITEERFTHRTGLFQEKYKLLRTSFTWQQFLRMAINARKKSGAVFLDLYSAYDTSGKRGLMIKLAIILKYKSTLRLIESLLSNRKYNVRLNDEVS